MLYNLCSIDDILPKFNNFSKYLIKELESEDFQNKAEYFINEREKQEKVIQFLVHMIIKNYNNQAFHEHYLQEAKEKKIKNGSLDFSLWDNYLDILIDLGIEIKYINTENFLSQITSLYNQLNRFGKGQVTHIPIGLCFHVFRKDKENNYYLIERYRKRYEKIIEGGKKEYCIIDLTKLIKLDSNTGYKFDLIVPCAYSNIFNINHLYLIGNTNNIIDYIDNYFDKNFSLTRAYQIGQEKIGSQKNFNTYIIQYNSKKIINSFKKLKKENKINLLNDIEFQCGDKSLVNEIEKFKKLYL